MTSHPNRISGALRLLAALLCALQLAACGMPRLNEEDRRAAAGKTFVVTGASSGIGRGIAEQLGSLGANVVLAARRTEVLAELADGIRRAGGSALVVTTDVSRRQDVAQLASASVERFGRIDVWINNAGIGALGRFDEVPPEDHARVIDVNVNGVIYGSHAALQQFRSQGYGALVNISSTLGQIPVPYQASYVASKAAVLQLGRALNQELQLAGHRHITVTTVLPWAVDTPFFMHAANYTGRTPRSVAFDDARTVAQAIVWVALHPRQEFAVGWKAGGAYAAHQLLPGLTESIAAHVEHRIQIESAAPAPVTTGNLYRPSSAESSVDGGMRPAFTGERACSSDENKPCPLIPEEIR